jgi:hypothetical protein
MEALLHHAEGLMAHLKFTTFYKTAVAQKKKQI